MVQNPFARDPAVTVGVGADTSGFGSAMDGAIGKLGSFKGAVAGVGVALGALATGALVKATQAAADFEEQMVEVEKVTNPETAAAMSDAIREMAETMPVAQSELAGIAAQAGRFGVEGEQAMRQFTESVTRMAVATDLSTDEAGEAFARMTTLMNEPIENVESLGSVVNELSNTMATSSSEITNSATRSAGALNQLGLQSEEILALNATMNEVSASSRIAGTRLRRFAQELQDPGKVEDLAAALGMTAEEFKQMRKESPNELIREMATRFQEGGEEADALRSALSTTSRQTLAGLSQNLDGLADAQGTANEQMQEGTSLQEEYDAASDTFNAQLQITRNRLRNVAIQIGENLLPIAASLLDHLNSAISTFSDFNDRTNGMAGTVGLVATALGGFAAAAASVVSMLGGASAVVGALGAAFAVLTGPIGLAIAAIALLAGAWVSNIGGIQEKTRAFVEQLRAAFQFLRANVIQPFLEWITPIFQRHFGDIADQVRQTAQVWIDSIRGFVEWARPYIQAFIAVNRAMWNQWGDEIMAVVRFALSAAKGIIETLLNGISTTIQTALALLRGDWEEAWRLNKEFVQDTLEGLIGFIGEWGGRLLDKIVQVVKDAGRAAGNALKNAFNNAIPDSIDVPETEVGGRTIGGQSINLPSLNTGGYIQQGGLAMLHAGERVVPAADVADRGGGGGKTIQVDKIEVHAEDGRDFGRQFVREMESRGFKE